MNRILITGANRGLGLEMTRQYLKRGEHVFAGCRTLESIEDLKQLAGQFPGQLHILQLDVTDPKSIDEAGRAIEREVNGLEILINNAAISTAHETIKEFQAEEALKFINTNSIGPLLVAQRVLELLKNGRHARIVNISSEAGSISTMSKHRGYYYFASKAALNMVTRSLAWDAETVGLIVIAIHPGWIRTDMGGPNADISPQESAAGVIQVADSSTMDENGQFFTWSGENHPW